MNSDEHLERGIMRAWRELGRGDQAALAPDEQATAVKYALVELLVAQQGDIAGIRKRARAGELPRQRLLRAAEAGLSRLLAAAARRWGSACADPAIRGRLVGLAVDEILGERLSPELLLVRGRRRLSGLPVHAVIFSAVPHVANELYPLMIDAYVSDQGRRGRRALEVVGVHEEWLQGASFRRAILFDEDRYGLLEADVLDEPPIAGAQVLALRSSDEAACHQRVEQCLGRVPLLNPYAGARLLDDKAATAACWLRAGLPTPRFRVVGRGTAAEGAGQVLESFRTEGCRWAVIKPVDGTEGRGVAILDLQAPPESPARALAKAAEAGDILVTEHRGELRFVGPAGPLRCAVRLNACWDGADARVESGYAQVAASPEGIASAGRGGRVIPLAELWTALCRTDGTPYSPTQGDWRRLLAVAADGVTALARELRGRMPALVGIDLLLDLDEAGRLAPLLLEANPRPAGMGHCHFVSPHEPTREPGVSLCLWDVVHRLLRV